MSEPITLSAEGYDELAIILRDAFKQASEGKGRERHANDMPFDQQPMQTLSDMFDSDKGMAFQVVKKLREGLDMPEYDRMERELLGSIVYTAGIILWHKRRGEAQKREEALRAMVSNQCEVMAAQAQTALVNAAKIYHEETDMTNPENWRAGDVVERVDSSTPVVYTLGQRYTVQMVNRLVVSIYDNLGADSVCHHRHEHASEKFRWVSRPTP